MGTSVSCPRCGSRLDRALVQSVDPSVGDEASGMALDALLAEVEELRATVARLRGSGSTSVIWSTPTCSSVPERG